jgi:predicted RNase H-like nuclease (RuvC/YqgF family)
VEREVYITDDEEVRQLGGKITKLEEDKKRLEEDNQKFSTKTEEIENIFQKEVIRYDTQISEYIRKISELESKPPTVVEKTTVDDSKQKALEETLRKLRVQMSEKDKKIKELEKTIEEIQSVGGKGATYLSGSNLGRTFK